MTDLAFGPLRYRLTGVSVEAPLAHFATDEASVEARSVEVRLVGASDIPCHTGPGGSGPGFAVVSGGGGDVVHAEHALGVFRAISALVVRDAPSVGGVVLHAGAVRVKGGVALLVAPPGTGKSTAVRAAGGRAFADNSVLVAAPGARAWALPFSGECRPEGRPAGPERVVLVAAIRRGSAARFEWLRGPQATMTLVRACVGPAGTDPHAAARATVTLGLLGALPVGRMDVSLSGDYLFCLDEACDTLEF